MKKQLGFSQRFFASALKHQSAEELDDPYIILRLQSVMVLCLIGITTLLFFGIANLMNTGTEISGYYQLFAAAVITGAMGILLKWGKAEIPTAIILGLLIPLFFYLLHTGGMGGSGAVWLFVLPPIIFYLVGRRWRFFWLAVVALGLLISAYLQISGVTSTAYSLIFLRQLGISLLILVIIIYFHEKVSDYSRKLVIQRSLKEESLNKELAIDNQRIEEAGARYHALVESIGDGIIAINSQEKITLVNQSALDMLKLKSEDVIGKKIDVFQVQDERGNKISYSDRILIKVLRTNKKMTTTINSHYYFVDSTGHRFPVASTHSPIINGKNQGVVCVFRDISQEKRLDDAKTELVSLASHQLNTPLTAVSWYTEMLLSGEAGKLTSMQQRYLQEIYAGSSRMVDLVNDFLNASRIEMGTFVPGYQPLEFTALIKSILDELNLELARKKITINRKFDHIPVLELDKRLIQISVQNLLSNAVKYTPENGSITVSASTAGTGRNRYLVISIADTGLGIPKAEQPYIFHKMFRANNAKKYEAEGTGLGLYIVKSAVVQMQGVISFKSEEGKGTTFTIKVPLTHSQTVASPANQLHRKG